MREGGGGGGDEAGGDLDLDLVANLKAHRTPPGMHDGVPDNCAHGLAMPYDMHSQGLWAGDSQGMPMAPTEHALRLVGTQGAWSEGTQGMHRSWTGHALGARRARTGHGHGGAEGMRRAWAGHAQGAGGCPSCGFVPVHRHRLTGQAMPDTNDVVCVGCWGCSPRGMTATVAHWSSATRRGPSNGGGGRPTLKP